MTVQSLTNKIQGMDTHVVNNLLIDIAKKAKKGPNKTMKSGTMMYSEFCGKIAETLQKPANQELIAKYNLQ
jgi:hypothetical protein